MNGKTSIYSLAICLLLHLIVTPANSQRYYAQTRSDSAQCPIGFNYLESTNLCYQVKRQEKFSQKYDRCTGNQVSLQFREEYRAAFKGYQINLFWTDYVRMYDNGPFVNWRYEDKEIGKPTNITIQSDNIYHRCAYMEISTGKLKSDYCNNTYARLCVVKPYGDSYPYFWDCPTGYFPYSAPVPTCLIAQNLNKASPRRVLLRATWQQASQICKNEYGFLPQRGFIYLNHGEFSYLNNQEIPLGLNVENGTTTWVKPYDLNDTKVSIYEQHFKNPSSPQTMSGYVALSNNEWIIKQSNMVYNNAVCEVFVQLPKVEINFYNQSLQRLYLNVSETIKTEDLWCFTDAFTYHPVKIEIFPEPKKSERSYFLNTIGNGYYWCAIVNAREFIPRESYRHLFVRANVDLRSVFAIKIKFYKDVIFSDYYIKEYLKSFFSDYNLVFGNNISEVLSRFQDENGNLPEYILRNKPLLQNIVIKSVYVEEKTALIHASFVNGFVKNYRLFKLFNFVYVRNVRYCEPIGLLNETFIGIVVDVVNDCKRFTCGGDFNEGAVWFTSDLADCIPQTAHMESPGSNNSDSTVTSTTETSAKCETTDSTPLSDTTTPLSDTTTPLSETTTVTTQSTTRALIISPEEEIENVINVIDDMLSGPVNSSQLHEAVNIISNLFDSVSSDPSSDAQIPSAILHGIEAILNKVELPDNQRNLSIVQPNLAVVVSDRSRNSSVAGIKLNSNNDDFLVANSLHLLEHDENISNDELNDIVVMVPKNVHQNTEGRILFTVFRDDKPFNQNSSRVNSRILSVSVIGMNIFERSNHIDMHFRPQSLHNENETKVCAYWLFQNEGGGKWSTDGCTLLPAAGPGGMDTCRCTHLTHFAQLITGKSGDFDQKDYDILTIISVVGCVLSLIGLVIIALTGIVFRSWRSDFSNKIWLHLSAAMSILIFTFLLVAFSNIKEENEVICIVTGVLLHYSVLASFGWMFMSAVLSYQRLVTVFTKSSSHKLLKACLCGWVLPFVPIGFLFIFDSSSYSQHFAFDQFSNDICYPSGLGLWLSVYLPIALIVIINAGLFFLIVYSVFINSKIKRHGDSKQLFRSITVSFLLFFLFGLTWIFGLFSHDIVMAYLFCITATNQGLVLCLFFIIGNKKTRDMWLVQLKIKEKKKLPSTTSMSRSFPSRANSKSGKALSIKRSDDDLPTKPRSLSVRNDKSDSRFS